MTRHPANLEQLLSEGLTHHRQGRLVEAEQCYLQVLAHQPAQPTALHMLGMVAHQSGRSDSALPLVVQAAKLQPDAGTYYNLGMILRSLGQLPAALESFKEAARRKPDYADAFSGQATLWVDLGFPKRALAAYDRAIALDPDQPELHSGRLLTLQYVPDVTPTALAEEHNRFAVRFEQPLAALRLTQTSRGDVPRRLRVGFVSGDLRQHPVGLLAKDVLTRLAGPDFELHFFPTDPQRRIDSVTTSLQAVGRWTPIDQLDDAAAARLIHATGIDILVDLAGHTGHNRLGVFAYKPAPLQVSWLGYTATTGLTSIDWLLSDAISSPHNERAHYSERIWHLPSRLCFSPPDQGEPLVPPPMTTGAPPTFGCFNNLAKVTEPVIDLWAQLLSRVPAARLLLKGRQLEHALVKKDITARFSRAGVAPERLLLDGFARRSDSYYPAFSRVDVCLDPFPFTGGTTTLDSLWMGVPVVTLHGDRMGARQGAAMLSHLGLDHWVAKDPEDYVRIASNAIAEPVMLAELRQGIRERMLTSVIGNTDQFAAALASSLLELWQRRSLEGGHKRRQANHQP